MNKTFHANNIHFNACVGKNGHIDYETYALGYFDAAKTMFDATLKHQTIVDIIVYPLVYSARHYIELIIKHQLQYLAIIKNILDSSFTYQLLATHDISTLWREFKRTTRFDIRYNVLKENAKPYIADFSQIDDNGEAFRYPYSKDNTQYLTELYCIDIIDFWKRFEKLSEILKDLNSLTTDLVDEYKQKSFLCGKSRQEIKEIAKLLPPIKEWEVVEFKIQKEKIKHKFSLSSNQLSKIILFIKKHREFSALIDNELMITDINPNELVWFIKIYEEYIINRDKKRYTDHLNEMITKINRKLKKQAIASLAQMYEMGYFLLYSEEYDKGMELKMKEAKEDLIMDYLLSNVRVKENIIRGFKIMGQKTLLNTIS